MDFPRAEAERLEYTCTAADCSSRLSLDLAQIRSLLASGELPSVRLRCKGRPYRVRPADLERVARTLPEDPILTGEAVSILAGRPTRWGTERYERKVRALYRAAKRGNPVRYVTPGGHLRWSRAEVEALRDQLAADGIGTGSSTPQTRLKAQRDRHAAEGLTDGRTVQETLGVRPRTTEKWGRAGLYGARKISGRYYFATKLLPPKVRARPEPPRTVTCTLCDEPVVKSAADIRRSQTMTFYHGECWRQDRGRAMSEGYERSIHKGRETKPSRETRRRMVIAQRRRWASPEDELELELERARRAAVMAAVNVRYLRSPNLHVERVAASVERRYGHRLSQERERELAGRALSRAQLASDRSADTRGRERRLRELWLTDRTVDEIAQDLGVTVSSVKGMRRRLELPARSRGRRPKK